ncbi:MAG: hypothetical protein ACK559_18225, partial [bacterium]
MVAQDDLGPWPLSRGGNRDLCHPRGRRAPVAARVLEQVEEHPVQGHLVGDDHQVDGHACVDADLAAVAKARHRAVHENSKEHRLEPHHRRTRVVRELSDDGVELLDVASHVPARLLVLHAHLDF